MVVYSGARVYEGGVIFCLFSIWHVDCVGCGTGEVSFLVPFGLGWLVVLGSGGGPNWSPGVGRGGENGSAHYSVNTECYLVAEDQEHATPMLPRELSSRFPECQGGQGDNCQGPDHLCK